MTLLTVLPRLRTNNLKGRGATLTVNHTMAVHARRHRSAIEVVASALLSEGALEADELDGLCEGAKVYRFSVARLVL
jgi:hypothetical protein